MNERKRGQSSGSKQNQQRGGRSGNGSKNGAKRKNRNRGRSKKVDPVKYWGDRDLMTIPESFVLDTPDTSVVATSLGRPPIPGQENASKHYLSLVYDRAAALAGALAVAGDIQNMAANAELELELEDEDFDGLVEVDGNRADGAEAASLEDESEPESTD